MRYVDGERWEKEVRAVIRWPGVLPPRLTQSLIDKLNEAKLITRLDLPDRQGLGLWYRGNAKGSRTWMLRCQTQTGKQLHYKIGNALTMSLEEAQERVRKERRTAEDGQDPQAVARIEAERQQTVRQYLVNTYAPRVLIHHKSGGVPVGTNGKVDKEGKPAGIYATLLAPVWASLLDRPLLALTRDHIEEALTAHKAKGVKGGTVRNLWGHFRAMLHDADKREVLGAELARRLLRRPDALAGCRDGKRIRWIGQFDTDEQVAAGTGERRQFETALAVFQTSEPGGGDFVRTAARLALATGMRRGELVRITDGMVNLRERTVSLSADVTKANRARVVHLSDAAVAAIKSWLAVRRTLAVQTLDGALFPGDPAHWERRLTAWNRDFHHLCKQAGITDLRWHDLRHDFSVRFLRAGGTMEQLQIALGHKSIVTTQKHYGHIVESDVRRTVLSM